MCRGIHVVYVNQLTKEPTDKYLRHKLGIYYFIACGLWTSNFFQNTFHVWIVKKNCFVFLCYKTEF